MKTTQSKPFSLTKREYYYQTLGGLGYRQYDQRRWHTITFREESLEETYDCIRKYFAFVEKDVNEGVRWDENVDRDKVMSVEACRVVAGQVPCTKTKEDDMNENVQLLEMAVDGISLSNS
jgi:hypothetical protein